MNLSQKLGSLSKFFHKISNNPQLSSPFIPNKNIRVILPKTKSINGTLINSSTNHKLTASGILPSLKYGNNQNENKLYSKSLVLNMKQFIGDSKTSLPTFNIDNYKNNLLTDINSILENDVFIQNQYIDPLSETNNDIQAARLIVIRRRKMKKHKLRKLRKKMKFEWAKVRQRREMRKEKAFQAQLIAQIKEAEKFSAIQYVKDKLYQANTEPIPRYWKGKRLPQFIIKQKLNIK